MDNVVLNADKNAEKWTFEKVANQQTLGNAGGSAGSRTPDHLIKSQMLYQLSYRPKSYEFNNLEGFRGLNKPSK